MELQPSAQNKQDEFAAWHPAARPNSHEHAYYDGSRTDDAHLYPKLFSNAARQNPPLRQSALPSPSEGLLQDQLPIDHVPAYSQKSVQSLRDSAGAAPDDNKVALTAEQGNSTLPDRQQFPSEDPSDESTARSSDVGPMRASPATSSHVDEQVHASTEDQTQEPASGFDKGGGNQALLSRASDFSDHAVGDKVEMERAWELEEKSKAADSAAHISRTNSFPVVPLAKQKDHPSSHPLPQSQVEVIMEEENAISPSLNTGDDRDEHMLDETFTVTTARIDRGVHGSHGEAAMKSEGDEDSRFEEGLPLLPTSENELATKAGFRYDHDDSGGLDFTDEEDDFDKALGETSADMATAPTFKPRPLDRKSTHQVLDSTHHPPHSAKYTESKLEETASLPDIAEDDFAIPAPTVNSHVLAEQKIEGSGSGPNDDDLAEIWKAALDDDDLLVDGEESVDPSDFFADDGEDFLREDPNQTEEHSTGAILSPNTAPNDNFNRTAQSLESDESRQVTSQMQYAPRTESQPRFPSQNLHSASLSHATTAAPLGISGQRGHFFQPTQPVTRPQMPASTQSFADKSKGGYTSPYDLPMDVTRPKKRPIYQQMQSSAELPRSSTRSPPPRSSSMFTGAPPMAESRPPVTRLQSSYSPAPASAAVPFTMKASPNVNSFFEELPSTKSRPSSSMGRYAPPPTSQGVSMHPPTFPQHEPPRQSPLARSPPSNAKPSSQQYELLPPERMSLYGNSTQAQSSGQVPPVVNSRYSPAPSHASSVPPSRNRYAASPSSTSRPPPSQILPFQPRTSSPLAHHHAQPPQSQQDPVSGPALRPPKPSDQHNQPEHDLAPSSFPFPRRSNLDNEASTQGQSQADGVISNLPERKLSPPPLSGPLEARLSTSATDSSYAMNTPESDQSSSNGRYAFRQINQAPSIPSDVVSRMPPRRSQTQSPGASRYTPQIASAQDIFQRPASVFNSTSLPSFEGAISSGGQARPRGRTISKDLAYIQPTDGREFDHLERWKGCPIFVFGFGGAIVTTFPKQIPRYATGQAGPMLKCSPGEVKVQEGKNLPIEEDLSSFPGPLKAKSKKKDVVDWLQRRISRLEVDVSATGDRLDFPDSRIRHEEKIMLWKIVQTMVEHDGILDNNASAEKRVRSILYPESTHENTDLIHQQDANRAAFGITRFNEPQAISNSSNPTAMEELRNILLQGEREKAVWHSVDNRLWPHAMLLSSTLDQNIWKQVAQEFIRQEVKTYGENTEALAALFQVFAGNWEETVDELVPPSARAGLQMVSKITSAGSTKNTLGGLDPWRETLTLILSNRSTDDGKALMSLGKLLAGYGRTEAAHICYIFSKSPNFFGGPDDPQVSIALLGSDHQQQNTFDYGRDLDSILLTEVFDFARTVLSSSAVATASPHLQSFKLYHAMILAELGYKSEALHYCETITSMLSSTTRRSPYFHAPLLESLYSLMERLRQAPRDSSGSWISKPSIDKVSGSIWAKFNQYVAGEESDTASIASSKGHDSALGPFAGVNSEPQTLSRTTSSNDLYNSYTSGISSAPTAISSPRQGPAGSYIPRSSFEQQGQPSQDPQLTQAADSLRPAVPQQPYQARSISSASSYVESYKPAALSSSNPIRTQSYLPTPPPKPQYIPSMVPDEFNSSIYPRTNGDETLQPLSQPSQDSYQPESGLSIANGYGSFQTTPGNADPPSYDSSYTNHYEPPASSGYSPPSYNDDVPLAEENHVQDKRREKFHVHDGDDDDDFEARAAALRKEDKARKDLEVDEAFRRAAEADGKPFPFSTAYFY